MAGGHIFNFYPKVKNKRNIQFNIISIMGKIILRFCSTVSCSYLPAVRLLSGFKIILVKNYVKHGFRKAFG